MVIGLITLMSLLFFFFKDKSRKKFNELVNSSFRSNDLSINGTGEDEETAKVFELELFFDIEIGVVCCVDILFFCDNLSLLCL